MPAWQIYLHLPVACFVFALGAIVGSFINVVIYRVPAGMSVITPPSRCPVCGARLRWWENLPIIGWWLVGRRCRHCRVPISPQYALVETLMALLFAGLYCAYYLPGPSVAWWGGIGGPWWYYNGPFRTAPAFLAILVMVAGLVAMTVIDARLFIIPIGIPRVVTVCGLLGWAVQSAVTPRPRAAGLWPVPATGWHWFAISAGGMLGMLAAWGLLRRGVLRPSFADYDQYVPPDQTFGDYPHARREMWVEAVFLLPVAAGLVAGWAVGGALPGGEPPLPLRALGGSMLGYLAGAAMVWAVRMLGTLAFGREAMGLGDVHLMGAIGAVLGWLDPVWIFMLAPFFGLAWAVVSMGMSSILRRRRRELPYGPHLAVATLCVLLFRPAFTWAQHTYFPWLPGPWP
jgi:leader peptidase (prepilin peptidase)/N-methyltransferase